MIVVGELACCVTWMISEELPISRGEDLARVGLYLLEVKEWHNLKYLVSSAFQTTDEIRVLQSFPPSIRSQLFHKIRVALREL